MTKIKVCGIRKADNALMVARAGVDMIGLNFYPKTPRYIEPAAARKLVSRLRGDLGAACPIIVGVFVNASATEIRAIAAEVGLDYAQLNGDESAEFLGALPGLAFKAIRPADERAASAEVAALACAFLDDKDAPSLLLDAFNPKLYGGTGETTSVSIAQAVSETAPRLMLAGGLKPENVAQRLQTIKPWGVDVASGVEAGTPGIKDEAKVRAFIDAVRSADA
ncbi:MAG: phosphoribosylanthranilate isomerase [Anaerolineae bacterium]|nr:phosphoribosylanthranilate isomerase [Anaerolineae bacterium]